MKKNDQNEFQLKNVIRQAIDLHFHIGPEIIPRKFTSVTKLIAAESGKIKGIALKNHFYPTQPFISESINDQSLMLLGSVTLNNFVGGLNPEAIYANSLLAKLPTLVWLPTINAAQFLNQSEFEIAPEWVQSSNFTARKNASIKPVPINQKITGVLRAIKKCNAVLATGHVSSFEAETIIKKANKMGLTKIIATHPIYQKMDYSLEVQMRLVKLGAKIEQCYSMYAIDKIPMKKIAQQIKMIGANNCLLSSDAGQVFSDSPSSALLDFTSLLLEQGISLSEIEIMLVKNPNSLVM